MRDLPLRVAEYGQRSWCFHYRLPREGKCDRTTIGTYLATSLAAGRGKALEARACRSEETSRAFYSTFVKA
jgi:hypothetical protein